MSFKLSRIISCSFKISSGLMHALIELVVAQDLFGFIKILTKNGTFTLDEYNAKLKSLELQSHEASDKPQVVPEKGKKLPGKALSLFVHIRNFPLIIRTLVDRCSYDDFVLTSALALVNVTERIMANEFRHHEIDILEDKIVEYLDMRKRVYADYPDLIGSAKPKVN